MKLLTFVLILLLLPIAHSAEPKLEQGLEKLAKQNPKLYLPKLYDKVNKEMNEAYAKQLSWSSPAGKRALEESQKAWLAFLEADSLYQKADAGGSSAAIYSWERKIYQTRLRTYQLQTPFEQGWTTIK